MGSPSALHDLTVQLVLNNIRHSELIPPHLLSQSLLQRHHFLHLTPDDPISYLSWPSNNNENEDAVRLIHFSTEHSESDAPYTIRYTGDTESTFAHVHVPTADGTRALRLIFQWDNGDVAWKYHNISLMPFPHGSREDVRDLSLTTPRDNPILIAGQDLPNEEEDSYWNAYGDDPAERTEETDQLKLASQSEDDYWASYAGVHGSGDSTVPSPLPTSKRKLAHSSYFSDTSQVHSPSEEYFERYHAHEESGLHSYIHHHSHGHSHADAAFSRNHSDVLISIPYESLHPSSKNPSDTISAYDLANRLEALGVPGVKVVGLDDVTEAAEEEEETVATDSPESIGLPVPETKVRHTVTDRDVYWNGFGAPAHGRGTTDEMGDEALRHSIYGLYRLWLSTRHEKVSAPAEDEFLRITMQVVRGEGIEERKN